MQSRSLIIGMVLALVFTSCAPVLNTYKVKNEQFGIQIFESEDALAQMESYQELVAMAEEQAGSRGFLAAFGLMSKLTSAAVSGVVKLIANEKEKYTQEYESSLEDLYFYNEPSWTSPTDPSKIRFAGFEILRMADIDKKTGIRDTAVCIRFGLDDSNPGEIIHNAIFRLKVTDFIFKYSKAKVANGMLKKKNVTIAEEKYVDFYIEVEVRSRWINKDGEVKYHTSKMDLRIDDLPLDPEGEEHQKFITEKVIGTVLNGHSLLPTRTYGNCLAAEEEESAVFGEDPVIKVGYKPCFGTGSYGLTVKVTEEGTTKVQQVTGKLYDEAIKMVP